MPPSPEKCPLSRVHYAQNGNYPEFPDSSLRVVVAKIATTTQALTNYGYLVSI